MTKIERAKALAHQAHDAIGQKRKYTGEPYWVHTDAVAELVAAAGGTDDMIAAAHLHDVLEDVAPLLPQYDIEMIAALGDKVIKYVVELTDVFTKERFPKYNRAQRKAMEHERLKTISDESKTIKAADIINNTESIVAHDKDFAMVYLREIMETLPYLLGANPILLNKASMRTVIACQTMGINIPVIG